MIVASDWFLTIEYSAHCMSPLDDPETCMAAANLHVERELHDDVQASTLACVSELAELAMVVKETSPADAVTETRFP